LSLIEHRLWVFENGGLRKKFGPKKNEEVRGGGGAEKIFIMGPFMISTTYKILFGRIRGVVHVARMAEETNANRLSLRTPKIKSLL
jgi:hypothetical protein